MVKLRGVIKTDMNAYRFFCEIPGLEITESHASFELAFRAQHAYADMVMDQLTDFDLIDRNMGIEERGTRVMAPAAMKRAQASGLMDQILTELTGSVIQDSPTEFDSVFSQENLELVPA